MNDLKVNDIVYIYDPIRSEVFEGTVKEVGVDDQNIVISPTNPHLPELMNIPITRVFKTFREAFVAAMELEDE